MKIHFSTRAALALAFSGLFFSSAHAASGGLDSTTDTLPIAVQGQTAITLTATNASATPPTTAGVAIQFPATFTGKITEGNTTINPDGSTTIGSNAAVAPASVLTVNGNVGIGTPLPAGTLDVEAPGSTPTLCLNGKCVQSFAVKNKVISATGNCSPALNVSGFYAGFDAIALATCPTGWTAVSCGFVQSALCHADGTNAGGQLSGLELIATATTTADTEGNLISIPANTCAVWPSDGYQYLYTAIVTCVQLDVPSSP